MLLRQQVGLLVCFAECLLFGGALYGWPSLVYVLKDDGVYSHVCPAAPEAHRQEQHLPGDGSPQAGGGSPQAGSGSPQAGSGSPQAGSGSPQYNGTEGDNAAQVAVPGRGPAYGVGPGAAQNASSDVQPNRTGASQGVGGRGHKEIRSHVRVTSLGCNEQDTHLALAVILAVLTQGLSALPSGRLFDKFGLRVTRSMASVFGFIGYNTLAFVQEGATSWLVYPGCMCIGIAQNIIMMTNCYLTELAGPRASTLVALYNGAMLASSGVLLMVKIAHDYGVPRTTSVTVLGGLWIITIVNTFTFLPKRKILRATPTNTTTSPSSSSPDTEQPSDTPYIPTDNNNQNGHQDAAQDDVSSNYIPAYELSWTRGLLASEPDEAEYEMVDMRTRETSHGVVNKPRDDARSWVTHVKSSLFVSYLYWFCSLHFRINVFISTFSLWVRMVVQEDKARESHFTDVYGYLNIAGIVLSPLPGLLIDYRRRKLARHERFGMLGAMAATPALTFSTAVALLMGLTSLLKYEVTIYISTVMCVVLRACVYPTGTAFIGLVWPSHVYGTLYGVTFTLLGAVAFLQYPFVIWASTLHRGNISMNALLLLLTVLSFLLPGHVLFKYRKRKETHDAASSAQS